MHFEANDTTRKNFLLALRFLNECVCFCRSLYIQTGKSAVDLAEDELDAAKNVYKVLGRIRGR